MAVYKRKNSETYSYDFLVDGVRYSGGTGTADLDRAIAYEKSLRDELLSTSSFCRSVIRRARRSVPAKASARAGYVYMIRSGYFIKIGHSHDPEQRFKSINTASPDGCELLFCIRGSMKIERELHREFAACHYKKEWFFLCGKLRHFVEEFEKGDASGAEHGVTPDFPPDANLGTLSS